MIESNNLGLIIFQECLQEVTGKALMKINNRELLGE